jgi:cyclopropane-fatty-acyl-phospholipid synthase
MLELVCERAELFDGMNFLELGCGWGSLSLYVAERFPRAQVTGVSNSHSQRDFIMRRAGERNLKNIQILTQDMNNFETNLSFDRVASIEMFEHMRNWDALLKKVASWMRPEAKLFIHVFCHREYPYLFETEGAKNWMGRYFFTAGMMPFDEIFLYFQKHLRLEKNWVVDGTHYSKTSRDWLKNLESNKRAVLDLFEKTYGSGQAQLWYQRWRLFFIACEECFGFQNGQQWWVAHARLCKV